jgi:hypothetical protein
MFVKNCLKHIDLVLFLQISTNDCIRICILINLLQNIVQYLIWANFVLTFKSESIDFVSIKLKVFATILMISTIFLKTSFPF